MNIYVSTYSHARTVQFAKSQRINHLTYVTAFLAADPDPGDVNFIAFFEQTVDYAEWRRIPRMVSSALLDASLSSYTDFFSVYLIVYTIAETVINKQVFCSVT